MTGKRFLNISMDGRGNMGAAPEFFIHRAGEVIGRVVLGKIYGATVVVHAADDGVLDQVKKGDLVEIEGEEQVISESFEGRVAEISSHGFVGIDVDRRSRENLHPVFLVYRNDDQIAKIRAERIVSLFVISELAPEGDRMRIVEGDYLRMAR